ncbi:MAG: TraR/DksA C4-type zinc finger protein [Nitrospinae bacterium]|nr:TraR/DksA C4-type zinc finger protein [Nitrospinota bacterium]
MKNKAHKGLLDQLVARKQELIALEQHSSPDKIQNLDLGHGDDMDIAESIVEQEMSITMKLRSSNEIIMIDEAIEKIKKGDYGTCENCERQIENKRLKARPFVKFCIECQEEMERNNEESASPGTLPQFGKLE